MTVEEARDALQKTVEALTIESVNARDPSYYEEEQDRFDAAVDALIAAVVEAIEMSTCQDCAYSIHAWHQEPNFARELGALPT